MRRPAILAGILAPILALAACSGGPEAQLEKARRHLAAGAYAEAASAADQGLAAGAKGALAWRLELAALEGQARSGRGVEVAARLDRLAGSTWAAQLTGPLYVQTAGQLGDAGDAEGAIEVLDRAAQRFPEDPDVEKAIERLGATGSPDEVERLRSLGYVE